MIDPFPRMYFYEPVDPEHSKRERRKAQELRQSQWWRQELGKGVCYHCGERFPKERLTMDHKIPVARGGKSTKNNCVVACKECNSRKGHQLDVERAFEEMAQAASGSAPASTPDSANREPDEN